MLTAAKCSVTPKLLAVKYGVQDNSINHTRWWMPGGYIVYVLMEKLTAQPLDYNTFWNSRSFTRQDRDEIRDAFKKAYM